MYKINRTVFDFFTNNVIIKKSTNNIFNKGVIKAKFGNN